MNLDRIWPCEHRVDWAHQGVHKVCAAANDEPVDVSYLGRAPTGHDQRYSGPCGPFAMLYAVTHARRVRIPISEAFRLYEIALEMVNGKPGDGLYYVTVCAAAVEIGWLPKGSRLHAATLSDIDRGPLLGAYPINRVIDGTNDAGTWDCSGDAVESRVRGYHAMCVLGCGIVGDERERRVQGVNPWQGYGDRGLWQAPEWLHRKMATELYWIEGLEVA